MSREIKFRAWDYTLKKMSDSFYPYYTQEFMPPTLLEYGGQGVELMQFIGLQDKKGVDIYEGDIVKVQALYDSAIGKVVFHECAWCFVLPACSKGENPYRNIGTGWYGIEVIGNIYENPELVNL